MAAPEKQVYSARDLDRIAERIHEKAASLEGIAASMRDSKTKQIEAQGIIGVDRGLDAIHKFLLNCSRDLGRF